MNTPYPNVRVLDLELEETGTGDLVSVMDSYLAGFSWARRTKNVWVGISIPEALGLFLVELDPLSEDIDKYIWVVVGDLPPAYISTVYAVSPKEALEGYIAEMDAWVRAVKNGESVEELIPVNGAPTIANAEALESRLSFITTKILPDLC